jgi:alpha-L-rhamnosidase
MKKILLATFLFMSGTGIYAQDVYATYRAGWLKKSYGYLPELHVSKKLPLQIVQMVKDTAAYQQVRAEKVAEPESWYNKPISANKGQVVDFGEHLTGHVQFRIESNIPAHAPVQIKIKFAEVPAEMDADFSNYEGSLSKAWLQEEIITLYSMPDTVVLSNRYAFRYMKFEVLASAGDMQFFINNLQCRAVSSAREDKLSSHDSAGDRFRQITEISLNTLRECMQTVFEDGPKRDRRIWIGDLKLQALANYYSFQNNDLVKRGLYLYAATAAENGLVYGTLFEEPAPHPQKHFPIDYCLLYNTVLTDYYEATKDKEVLEDLWVVAKYQVLNVLPFISETGVFTLAPRWWNFIDWNDQLDKQVAVHGTIIYALEKTWELATLLNRQNELPGLPGVIASMKKAANEKYFNNNKQLFASGTLGQISTASQVWMILSGAVSPKEGRNLFGQLKSERNVVQPVSPYLYHYVAEAMITCGMYEEAKQLIGDYWGGMADKGADTFWEVYDPGNDFLSPYGSFMMNSYCHAWSCTPVYFLRKYRNEFFTE